MTCVLHAFSRWWIFYWPGERWISQAKAVADDCRSKPHRLRLLSYNTKRIDHPKLLSVSHSQLEASGAGAIAHGQSRWHRPDLTGYDIVGLQEVDAGSLRSGFVNRSKYLADSAGFKHVFDQTNRKVRMISQHSNAMLSRFRPSAITEHKLPGLIPGRGVLEVRFGSGADALHVLISHMALGRRGRLRQVEFLIELVRDYRHVILMGDLNCGSDSPEMAALLAATHLREPAPGLYTFPSWRPDRQLDHILVSSLIEVEQVEVSVTLIRIIYQLRWMFGYQRELRLGTRPRTEACCSLVIARSGEKWSDGQFPEPSGRSHRDGHRPTVRRPPVSSNEWRLHQSSLASQRRETGLFRQGPCLPLPGCRCLKRRPPG